MLKQKLYMFFGEKIDVLVAAKHLIFFSKIFFASALKKNFSHNL
jgi:hypothetical protein